MAHQRDHDRSDRICSGHGQHSVFCKTKTNTNSSPKARFIVSPDTEFGEVGLKSKIRYRASFEFYLKLLSRESSATSSILDFFNDGIFNRRPVNRNVPSGGDTEVEELDDIERGFDEAIDNPTPPPPLPIAPTASLLAPAALPLPPAISPPAASVDAVTDLTGQLEIAHATPVISKDGQQGRKSSEAALAVPIVAEPAVRPQHDTHRAGAGTKYCS